MDIVGAATFQDLGEIVSVLQADSTVAVKAFGAQSLLAAAEPLWSRRRFGRQQAATKGPNSCYAC